MQSLDEIRKMVEEKFISVGQIERYKHTLGVGKMALTLANQYGIDPTKALLAAYLHDFCKYDSLEEITSLLDPKDIEECESYPVLYHSYASAQYYKKYIGKDEEIYEAIRNHVFGRLHMTRLEEIILISDYTEENRMYPNCIKVRETLLSKDLYKAIYESTYYTIEFLKSKNINPHPLQMEVLKYYEGKCKQ